MLNFRTEVSVFLRSPILALQSDVNSYSPIYDALMEELFCDGEFKLALILLVIREYCDCDNVKILVKMVILFIL